MRHAITTHPSDYRRGNARSAGDRSAKIVLVLRPAIPFLELRIEFYEVFLRQIRMSLLRHEFPEL